MSKPCVCIRLNFPEHTAEKDISCNCDTCCGKRPLHLQQEQGAKFSSTQSIPDKPGDSKDEAGKVMLYRGREPNMQEDKEHIVTKGK